MAYRNKTVRNYKRLNLKRKVRLWMFRFYIALSIVLVFFFAYSFYFNKNLIPGFLIRNIDQLSHRVNYLVSDIQVIGEDDNCKVADIPVLEKYKGVATLLISVDDIRNDLESIDCVGKVDIMRVLPNKIKVMIEPRVPIAIWQHKHKFFFVASDGSVLSIRSSNGVSKFIIVIGDDAPQVTPELLRVLSKDQDLYAKIVSAVWIGERRWNIIFDNGTELLLPEENYAHAWNKFVELSKNNEMFKPFAHRVVDLRVQNRIYVK